MIPPEQRLCCPDGLRMMFPHALMIWNFIDFDTRKWLMFEGPVDPFGNDEGQRATEVLLAVIDQLENDVTKITFTADGKRWNATKSSDDDVTPVVSYPRFTEAEVGGLAAVTLKRGTWEEIDRLGPDLDLVKTRPAGADPRSPKKLFVFKYYTVPRLIAEHRAWKSAFYHRALSTHPNIVSFGDFVVDEKAIRLVGYTTKYISGGSLNTRHISVFKRTWVKQLTELIDHLNLRYGLLHQDVAPKNLILDDEKDQMLLFDFEYATLHGSKDVMQHADDVLDLCFTIYELLTGDQETGHDRFTRKLQSIMSSAKQWPLRKHMELEHGVSTDMIKHDLNEWMRKRRAARPSTFDLQDSIFCPEMKIDRVMEAPVKGASICLPAHLIRYADPSADIVRWERPATAHLRLRRSSRDRSRKG